MPIQQITPIPVIDPATGRPPRALPKLWNDRYLEMDANFQALQDDLSNGLGNVSYNDLQDKPNFGNAAFKNVGTGSSNVAAGNHGHSTGQISGLGNSATLNKSDSVSSNSSNSLATSKAVKTAYDRANNAGTGTLNRTRVNNGRINGVTSGVYWLQISGVDGNWWDPTDNMYYCHLAADGGSTSGSTNGKVAKIFLYNPIDLTSGGNYATWSGIQVRNNRPFFRIEIAHVAGGNVAMNINWEIWKIHT